MFDTLSAEQERLLDQFSLQMRADSQPDESCADASIVAALDRIYRVLGMRGPLLVWCDGPFQLAVMPLLLQLVCFRAANKKADDLNIDERVSRLRALLTVPKWRIAFDKLISQVSTTSISSLKYEDANVPDAFTELFERFRWSRCGVPTGAAIGNLLQKARTESASVLASSATLGLSTALTTRLYTRPIDQIQSIKKSVGQTILRDHALSLRDNPMSVFGSAKGSMSQLYKRAQELHLQIADSTFESELSTCLAPQAHEKFRQPRLTESDTVLNTAGLLAFGPYDALWCSWASYAATCYAIIGDFLRDQFSKETREVLSDLSLILRSGFAYTPLSRVVFMCKSPRISLNENNQLHHESEAAIQFADGYKIYAWKGIPVPSDIFESPETLTSNRIDAERNVELRRALIDKFGMADYLRETGAGIRDQNEYGTLYLKQLPGDEPIALVRVTNSTPEPDGSFKEYFIRVPPSMKTVRQAVAWTFYIHPDDYDPSIET